MFKDTSQITIFVIATTGVILILTLLVISLLHIFNKRKALFEENLSKLRLNYEKNLLQAQIEIQEQTFLEISRNIHDNINLSLTLAKLNLNTLKLESDKTSENIISASTELIATAITELKDLSRGMNPELIQSVGFINALQNEIERINRITQLDIECDIQGNTVFLDGEKELVLFRIVQEALNNIIRHAKASKIILQLYYADENIKLKICDNGIGFQLPSSEHINLTMSAGLRNMETRATVLGGTFSLVSNPGEGTNIEILIPY
jgi:two-component system NarL family sensor kinase